MPRRTTVPRKLKYEVVPLNKTVDRFVVKVMLSGKRFAKDALCQSTLAAQHHLDHKTVNGFVQRNNFVLKFAWDRCTTWHRLLLLGDGLFSLRAIL